MISVEIEKEINQENKVILNFNIRQVVCLGITLAFILFIIFVLGIDYEIAVYPAGIVAVIMAAFGWYKPNGLPFEKVLLKKAQQFFYHSNVRKYRTKNQYVTMLNAEYNRRRGIDMQDKKLVKKMKKAEKKRLKLIKKSRKKAVCKPIK